MSAIRRATRRSETLSPAWWGVNLAIFAAAQLLDVVTTVYGLFRGLAEGSPLSQLLIPAGDVRPWVAVKVLAVILVAALAGFVMARPFPLRIQVLVNLIIAALSVVTVITGLQNLLLIASA